MGSIFLSDGQSSVSEFLTQQPLNSTDAEYQRVMKLIDEANPSLPNSVQCTVPDEPILVPSPGHSLEPVEKSNYEIFKSAYRATPTDGRQLLKDVAENCEQFYEFLAISEWASETFANYTAISGAADFNTGVGGMGAMLEMRGNTVTAHLSKIDELLRRYAAASANQKGQLKQQIKLEYEKLHGKFGKEISQFMVKVKPNAKQSPLISSNNAMKIATGKGGGSRTMPLMGARETKNLMKVLGRAKNLGRGIVVLDLGFRANNVRSAPDALKSKTFFLESAGFAASTFGAATVAKALAPVILFHPILGLLLIVVLGATAAISMDYLGKYLGDKVWDYGQPKIKQLYYGY